MIRNPARPHASSVRRSTIWLGLLLPAALLSLGIPSAEAERAQRGQRGQRPTATAPADPGFQRFLDGVRRDALARGIRPATVNRALTGLKVNERAIELDRKQPESTITFATYRERAVTQGRIREGQRRLAENRRTLERIEPTYGVPAEIAVALWGIETSYGKITGGFNVVEAVATLAYEGRRHDMFRNELLDALQILDEGHISVQAMKGSWAGAMGQCQFMPSSFRRFAVDGDGDGRRDIWTTIPDVLASAANFLSGSGWDPAFGWGQEVVARGIAPGATGDAASFAAQGVRTLNGRPLIRGTTLTLVAPDGPGGATFLVTPNFDVIKRWNRSNYFAATVGLVSDGIAGR